MCIGEHERERLRERERERERERDRERERERGREKERETDVERKGASTMLFLLARRGERVQARYAGLAPERGSRARALGLQLA